MAIYRAFGVYVRLPAALSGSVWQLQYSVVANRVCYHAGMQALAVVSGCGHEPTGLMDNILGSALVVSAGSERQKLALI